LQTTVKYIENQMRAYAKDFLTKEYGKRAVKKLETIEIKAVDAYDDGGVSEITEKDIKIAVRRDIFAGKLTNTTKIILRHELGHLLDENAPDFPEFREQIEHEKIAWKNAKLKGSAEKWYKNVSIRTHIDPLKMQSMGFPRPEKKISQKFLKRGIEMEFKRMRRDSSFVDVNLAARYAMANLIDHNNFYDN
jgi:hypothetical protein